MTYFGLKQATLITNDKEETIDVSQGVIHVKPLWRWLLEDVK